MNRTATLIAAGALAVASLTTIAPPAQAVVQRTEQHCHHYSKGQDVLAITGTICTKVRYQPRPNSPYGNKINRVWMWANPSLCGQLGSFMKHKNRFIKMQVAGWDSLSGRTRHPSNFNTCNAKTGYKVVSISSAKNRMHVQVAGVAAAALQHDKRFDFRFDICRNGGC